VRQLSRHPLGCVIKRKDKMPTDLNNTIADESKLFGPALYSPIVIAIYCALVSFIAGFILYGINLFRRGQIWLGRLFIGLSIVVYLGMMIASFIGSNVLGGKTYILGIIISFGLFKMESIPYAKALSLGAVKAKWWPPLLWSILIIVVSLLILYFLGPEKEY
jgi:hypothetical protein